MAEPAVVSINIKREIKEQAEALLNPFGMDLATAFNLFVHTIVTEQSLPLSINLIDEDIVARAVFRDVGERTALNGGMSDEDIAAVIEASRKDRANRG